MIKSILKNIAYLYYPKGISNIEQKEIYQKSLEFKRLLSITNNFSKENEYTISYNLLLSEFKKHEKLKDIKDVSLLHWQDRALSFEIDFLLDNKLNKLCLNISLLIPYYVVILLENEIELNPYKWVTLPKRNRILEATEYKDLLNLISSIVEDTIKYNKFPEDLVNTILPDLSFNDIRIGNFTFYNAFFLDDNKL